LLGGGACIRATPPLAAALTIKATGFRSGAFGTNIITSTMDNTQQYSLR